MAFTRVLGPGIHTASNINSHNINSTGIITAVSFVGNGAGLTGIASTDNIITGTAATFNTYPVDINAGMDVVGVSSFQDIDVDGHTNLDNVSIAGVTTMSGDLMIDSPSGQGLITIQGTTPRIAFTDKDHNPDYRMGNSNGQFFLYDVSNGKNRFYVYNNTFNIPNGTNLDVDGHTNLDNVSIAGVTTTTDDIIIGADNKKLKLGAGEELELYQDGNHSNIKHNGGNYLRLLSNAHIMMDAAGSKTVFVGDPNGQSALYFNGSKKLNTLNGGVDITGSLQVDSFHCLGPINLDSDIDVDGHTNLDNVSIAGVTTFSGGITGTTANLTGALTGTTANFSGNVTVGGVLTYEDVKNVDSIGIATARAGLKVLAGGANIVGVVTATSFVGDGSNLTGITQTTINSNVNNYLITGTGTANTLQGESGLTFNGSTLTVNSTTNEQLILSGATHPFIRFQEGTTDKAFIQWSGSGYLKLKNEEDGATLRLRDTIQFSTDDSTFYTMWHAGNDGAGSGLDADVLDGIQASSFVRSDATDTLTGEITLSNNLIKFSGTSNDRTVMHFIKSGEIKWRLLQNSFNAGGGDNLNFDRVNGTGVFMVDGYRVLTTSDINAQASGAVHSGISTFQDIDVDGHTNLDNVNVVGVVTASAGFRVPDGTFNTNLIGLGNHEDFIAYHDSAHTYLQNKVGDLRIQADALKITSRTGVENYIHANLNGAVEVYYDNSKKFETSEKGVKVGTGVTIETNGQATYTGIITATAFKLADGSAIGAGAGGTWSTYTAGIATSKSVGVNTSNLDDNDLVGVGNSFQGLYISNGMIIHDNTLRGNHYIGTAFNGLMAGPVNIEGTLSVDGSYVVV